MITSVVLVCLGGILVAAAPAADSLNVRLVGRCHTPDASYGVAVRGDYAFVADWSAGLRVISVADPASPTEVGHVDAPDSAVRVTVSDNYAYVVGVEAGLRVISVADPANPIEVGSYDTPGIAGSVAVDDNYAYVADMDSGLWVISISEPTHPTKVGHWQESGSMTSSIAVAGHFVCIVDYLHGLRVISVADPANPYEVGHNDSVGFAAVAARGNYVYVGNNGPRLSVVSLADSTHPVEVGWCNTFEPAGSIAVDDYCCTTGGERLYVVSVSDPAHPDTAGYYYKSSWGAHGLATSGDYIYVASDSGFLVCQRYDAGIEESTNLGLLATTCQPVVVRGILFLAETTDHKPQAASMVDATGRKVMNLRPGANDVSLLAPGVYFVSELTGSVRKVIIAR
jgi:hypothetical protein